MKNDNANDDDEIDNIVYKGVVPSDPGDHDTFFGSQPPGGEIITLEEGDSGASEDGSSESSDGD